jgi:hypothetical protein
MSGDLARLVLSSISLISGTTLGQRQHSFNTGCISQPVLTVNTSGWALLRTEGPVSNKSTLCTNSIH